MRSGGVGLECEEDSNRATDDKPTGVWHRTLHVAVAGKSNHYEGKHLRVFIYGIDADGLPDYNRRSLLCRNI